MSFYVICANHIREGWLISVGNLLNSKSTEKFQHLIWIQLFICVLILCACFLRDKNNGTKSSFLENFKFSFAKLAGIFFPEQWHIVICFADISLKSAFFLDIIVYLKIYSSCAKNSQTFLPRRVNRISNIYTIIYE